MDFLWHHSLKILPANPPGYSLLSFLKVWDMPTFQMKKHAFPVSVTGLLWCFSVVKQL